MTYVIGALMFLVFLVLPVVLGAIYCANYNPEQAAAARTKRAAEQAVAAELREQKIAAFYATPLGRNVKGWATFIVNCVRVGISLGIAGVWLMGVFIFGFFGGLVLTFVAALAGAFLWDYDFDKRHKR